ncbi:hypothetical protein GQ457_15G020230 [Hibiscus cannabinus]
MAHYGDENVEVVETQRETRAAKAKRATSRDRLSTLEDKVERLEDGVRDAGERLDVVDGRLSELETKGDEFKDDVNIAFNKVMEEVGKASEPTQVALAALKEEFQAKFAKLEVELAVCKAAIVSRGGTEKPRKRGDVPRPKEFSGDRNAQVVENFLWGMEKYFRSMSIEDDSDKVNTATDYLTDAALIWWRRRCDDEKRGSTKIGTWEEFRTEFKAQYYPVYAERDARVRMRHIKQEGSIREYVKKFTELMLEIPDLSEEDAFINFTDGLQRWARVELDRRGIKEISKALSVAESLIEVGAPRSDRTKSSKPRSKGNGGGDAVEQ